MLDKINTSIASSYITIERDIRNDISSDQTFFKRLADIADETGLEAVIFDKYRDIYPEEELKSASKRLAVEIIELRKNPGTYLMMPSGEPAFKLTADMIYQPAPVHTESGIKVIAPKLHPKISSGITLAVHEAGKLSALEKKYKAVEPFKHLRDPWSIIEEASKTIPEINIAGSEEECEHSKYFELGRENINGIYQAFNPSFIRYKVFGKSLAKLISELNPKKYLVSELERRTDSKYSWYDVVVKYS